jgi:hypothetical protein
MSNLTIKDLNNEVNHEPRIMDLRLGEFLGFAQPVNIKKLIRKHIVALEKIATVSAVETVKRGQKSTSYYLNKKQAIYICIKSETELATEKTLEIVEIYDAYTQGKLTSPATHASKAPKIAPADASYEALSDISQEIINHPLASVAYLSGKEGWAEFMDLYEANPSVNKFICHGGIFQHYMGFGRAWQGVIGLPAPSTLPKATLSMLQSINHPMRLMLKNTHKHRALQKQKQLEAA